MAESVSDEVMRMVLGIHSADEDLIYDEAEEAAEESRVRANLRRRLRDEQFTAEYDFADEGDK